MMINTGRTAVILLCAFSAHELEDDTIIGLQKGAQVWPSM